MKKQNGFVNIALVVVIVILAGIVGYFAFVKKSVPIAQQPTPTQKTTPTKTPVSPTPTPDKISTWKTYTNSQYGFEVKYPDTWKVSETAASVNFTLAKNAQDVYLSFFVYNKPISEAEALLPLLSVPGRKIDSRTNVTINGIAWVKLVVEKNQIALLTYSNGKTYAAQYSTFENVSPQILSTFKFTKPTSVVPADWKVYRNDKYGYEIKYPPSAKVGFYFIDGFHSASNLDSEVQIIVSNQIGCEGGCGVYITGYTTRTIKNSANESEINQILSTFKFTK